MAVASVNLGRLDEARKVLEEVEPLTRLGNPGAVTMAPRSRVYLAVMESGNLEAIEEAARNDLEAERRANVPWVAYSYVYLGFLDLWRGRFQEAIANFEQALRLEQPGLLVGVARSALFLGKAYAGERQDAERQLKEIALPRRTEVSSYGKWWSLPCVVEGLAVLDDRKRAAEIYPLVLEAIGLGSVVGYTFHLFQKVAGISAAAGGQWQKAEQHYQTALRQVHEIPHRLEQPEVRRWFARMLIERDLPGDRENARKLLEEAIEAYQMIGMPKHLELAQQMRSNL
jgi:tetratricopeptide (TPR) repeat protein